MNGHPLRVDGSVPGAAILCALASSFLCCTGPNDSANSATSPVGAGASCAAGQPLTGAAYDVTKSRFAFGSTPVAVDAGPLVRWTGTDGVVAIWSDGSEDASLDANAPEANLADWSSDAGALAAHVTAYFVSMGVATCQIAGTDATYTGGGGGNVDGSASFMGVSQTNVGLARGIDGIPVTESHAFARFDTSDQTTFETFYWPEIPADVVTAARAFHDKLAAPGALAAYKAKLPADAQGDGGVVIHHRVGGSSLPFTSLTTYDTVQITPQNDGGELHFDPNGNPVMDTWEAF